jgi:hypothetical protein
MGVGYLWWGEGRGTVHCGEGFSFRAVQLCLFGGCNVVHSMFLRNLQLGIQSLHLLRGSLFLCLLGGLHSRKARLNSQQRVLFLDLRFGTRLFNLPHLTLLRLILECKKGKDVPKKLFWRQISLPDFYLLASRRSHHSVSQRNQPCPFRIFETGIWSMVHWHSRLE